MPKQKKIYIIAGESSGDLIGSYVIKNLKELDKNIIFKGVGGSLMEKQGLKSLFDMYLISVMGIFEILPRLFTIYRLLGKTIKEILEFNPDVLLTIDSPGFNNYVAKKIKQKNPNIKLIHYVAPTVWAWKPKRAKKIAKIFDLLLCILPFEPKYFIKEGLNTVFVGHLIVENTLEFKINLEIKKHLLKEYSLSDNSDIAVILPGSREFEIKNNLEIFVLGLIKYQNDNNKKFQIVIPTFGKFVPVINKILNNFKNKLDYKLIVDESHKKYFMQIAKIALASSGTVSLELAIYKIPTIVGYKINKITHFLIKKLIYVKYASIINILLDKMIIPELLQYDFTVENVAKNITAMDNTNYMENYYNEINNALFTLGMGNFSPSEKASKIIYDFLQK
jgi:lipid-A-disaccharide synthase